jgi:hypothetical protein
MEEGRGGPTRRGGAPAATHEEEEERGAEREWRGSLRGGARAERAGGAGTKGRDECLAIPRVLTRYLFGLALGEANAARKRAQIPRSKALTIQTPGIESTDSNFNTKTSMHTSKRNLCKKTWEGEGADGR